MWKWKKIQEVSWWLNMKSESEWINELTQQGFYSLLFRDAEPYDTELGVSYDLDRYIVVFDGEIEIEIGYQTYHLGVGDYLEITRATEHSIRIGLSGSRYLLAQRI